MITMNCSSCGILGEATDSNTDCGVPELPEAWGYFMDQKIMMLVPCCPECQAKVCSNQKVKTNKPFTLRLIKGGRDDKESDPDPESDPPLSAA